MASSDMLNELRKLEQQNQNEEQHEAMSRQLAEMSEAGMQVTRFDRNQMDGREVDESGEAAWKDAMLIKFALTTTGEKAFALTDVERVKLEAIRGRKMAHALVNHKYGKDNEEMANLKDALVELETALDETYEVDPDKLYLSRSVNRAYKKALGMCRTYLKAKRFTISGKGIRRIDMVSEIASNLLNEMQGMRMAQQLAYRKILKGSMTGREMVSAGRLKATFSKQYTGKEKEEKRKEKFKSYSTGNFKSFNQDSLEDAGLSSPEVLRVLRVMSLEWKPSDVCKDKNDRKNIETMRNLYGMLSDMKRGTLDMRSCFIDGAYFDIFQEEDDGLLLSDGDSNVIRIPVTAKQIMDSMNLDMMSHEEIFGPVARNRLMEELEAAPEQNDVAGWGLVRSKSLALLAKDVGKNSAFFSNISDADLRSIVLSMKKGLMEKEDVLAFVQQMNDSLNLNRDADEGELLETLRRGVESTGDAILDRANRRQFEEDGLSFGTEYLSRMTSLPKEWFADMDYATVRRYCLNLHDEDITSVELAELIKDNREIERLEKERWQDEKDDIDPNETYYGELPGLEEYERERQKQEVHKQRGEKDSEQQEKELRYAEINTKESQELVRMIHANEEKYKDKIVFREKQKEEKKAFESLTWTEEEQKVKDLIADILYPEDTFIMDENNMKPGAHMRHILSKHAGTLAMIVGKPELLRDMMDKLPIADEFSVDPEVLGLEGVQKTNLKDMVYSVILKTMDTVPELKMFREFAKEPEEKEKEEEKPQEDAGVFGALFGFVKNIGKSIKKNVKKVSKVVGTAYAEVKIKEWVENEENAKKLISLEETMNKQLSDTLKVFQFTMREAITEHMKPTEKNKTRISAKNPFASGISAEEYDKRVKEGNKQLEEIIKESVNGEKGQGEFLRQVLSDYVSSVDVIDQRSMFAGALRNAKPVKLPKKPVAPAEDAPEKEKEKYKKALEDYNSATLRSFNSYLGGVFKGAGPLLQKTLQGIPDTQFPEELREALNETRSNLADIPQDYVKAQLAGIIERSDGKIGRIEVMKSLGAASVGQAFLCKLYAPSDKEDDGREVVIKVLRPDAKNHFEREKKIMLSSAKKAGSGMYATYMGQLKRIEEELDLTLEAKNIETGKMYDKAYGQADVNSTDSVTAMKLDQAAAPTTNTMVLKLADGTTVDRYMKDTDKLIDEALSPFYVRNEKGEVELEANGKPKLSISPAHPAYSETLMKLANAFSDIKNRQGMVATMARKWVEEGLFKSGFYHGDLHAGNIMVSKDKLTVIDFGNATKLTAEQQDKVTRLIMAAAVGNVEDFRHNFHELLEETPEEQYQAKKAELTEVFAEIFQLGNSASTGQRLYAAILRAQEIGIEIPPTVQNFVQCQIRLMGTMDSMSAKMDEIGELVGKFDDAKNYTEVDPLAMYMNCTTSEQQKNARFVFLPDTDEELEYVLADTDREYKSKFFESALGSLFRHDMSNASIIFENMTPESMNPESPLFEVMKNEVPKVLREMSPFLTEEQMSRYTEIVNGYFADFDNYKDKTKEICDHMRKLSCGSMYDKYYKILTEGTKEEKERLPEIRRTMLEGLAIYKKHYLKSEEKPEGDNLLASYKAFSTGIRKRIESEDEKVREKAMSELSARFINGEIGKELESSFRAYENTKQTGDAAATDAAFEKFVRVLKKMSFKEMVIADANNSKQMPINIADKGETFLDVMVDVVSDNFESARKRIGGWTGFQYSRKLKKEKKLNEAVKNAKEQQN